MLYKCIQKMVNGAVKSYLDRLPDEIIVQVASKVMGAEGLTESNYRKIVENCAGDKTATIYFGNGDHVVISSTREARVGGPGW